MPGLSMSLGFGLSQRPAGSVASFSPASLFTGGVQGGWYDPSDLSSMYQDSAGTVPAAVDQPVGKINDKSGNGVHLTQATTAAKPVLRSSGGLYWLEFDGIDDKLQSGAASLAALSDIWAALSNPTPDTSYAIFANGPADPYAMVGISGGSGAINNNGTGTTGTTFVNGTQLGSEDRGVFHTALGTTPKVAEVHDYDKGSFAQVGISNYGGSEFGGRIYGAIWIAAQSAANRNAIRTYLGSKAGLTL